MTILASQSISGYRNGLVVHIGVITLIGQNVEFTVKDKVQDDKGRYLILHGNIQVSKLFI